MKGLWPILNSFLHRMKLTDLVSFFSCGYPVPQHSWRERVPFLQFFDTFVKSELAVAVWTGFWSCCYVLLVSSLPPNSRLLVVVTYDLIVIFFCSSCFDDLGYLCFHVNIEFWWGLNWICALNTSQIFSFSLTIHEHGRSSHSPVPSSVSFFDVVKFALQWSFISFSLSLSHSPPPSFPHSLLSFLLSFVYYEYDSFPYFSLHFVINT